MVVKTVYFRTRDKKHHSRYCPRDGWVFTRLNNLHCAQCGYVQPAIEIETKIPAD